MFGFLSASILQHPAMEEGGTACIFENGLNPDFLGNSKETHREMG